MRYFQFFLLTFIALQMTAQQWKGKIIDSVTGEPLELVTVFNFSKKNHTHTDVNGRFVLDRVANGDSLVATIVGYERHSFIVSSHTSFTISLKQVPVKLDQVTISPNLNTLNQIRDVDLQINPVNSSQEILRKVPGLFIAQHGGGGKAEQIFLRGFDIDHGTDIQITADGIPVNMPSHAHGQGYADLHFIIPETVEAVDFGKGPYHSNRGNFATAGYVDFKTKNRLDKSSVKMEVGDFNTLRMVSMIDLLSTNSKSNAYLATENLASDGPFTSPQNFNRLNLFGKFNTRIGNDFLTLQLSFFTSKWDASGQIPLRAVKIGLIDRFGAIDDTEGGETFRQNLLLDYTKTISHREFIQTKAFISKYDFELYSNFTFFLNDPIHGDQIRQKESRKIYGLQNIHNYRIRFLTGEITLENGIGFRYDDINGNELSHSKNRKTTLDSLSFSDIDELNGIVYSDFQWENGDVLINAGVRLDHFRFEEIDFLSTSYVRNSKSRSIVSPKVNLVYKVTDQLQVYVKSGKGFHSNDTRVVLKTIENTLPGAVGYDLGIIYRPFVKLILDVAYWQLYSDQELVYVGDVGIVEPNGRTKRTGLDMGINYQMNNRLFAFAHLNYTNPRAQDEPEGANYIPLAPIWTSTGGITYRGSRIGASINYRLIGDRSANQDNSVTAEGYFISNLSVSYNSPVWSLGVAIENLFNVEWREAQFETESKLSDESASISEIHFTPGVPFYIKAGLTIRF